MSNNFEEMDTPWLHKPEKFHTLDHVDDDWKKQKRRYRPGRISLLILDGFLSLILASVLLCVLAVALVALLL
jgi:hypothetical protein